MILYIELEGQRIRVKKIEADVWVTTPIPFMVPAAANGQQGPVGSQNREKSKIHSSMGPCRVRSSGSRLMVNTAGFKL